MHEGRDGGRQRDRESEKDHYLRDLFTLALVYVCTSLAVIGVETGRYFPSKYCAWARAELKRARSVCVSSNVSPLSAGDPKGNPKGSCGRSCGSLPHRRVHVRPELID